jgi:hypothetical protein
MNRQEALTQLKSGVKLTHRFFLPDEYIIIRDDKIQTEDGYDYTERFYNSEWAENDWMLFNE